MTGTRSGQPAGAPDDYRPCAAIVLFDPTGRVLVADRIDVDGPAWQLPQGGVDDGESPEQAALREMAEELGTGQAEVAGTAPDWTAYDLPAPVQGSSWGGRYRGQRVMPVALLFSGRDEDIDLATAHPEFRTWKWVELEDLPALVVAFKKPLYEAVVTAFAPLRDRLRAGQADATRSSQ